MRGLAIAICVCLPLTGACGGGRTVPADGGPCRPRVRFVVHRDEVDLLIVVDDASSMGPAQQLFGAALPELVDALTTGDIDGDGRQDEPAAQVLHVGVITTDMGALRDDVPSCQRSDDGVLRDTVSDTGGCATLYPAFLDFSDLSGGTSATTADAVCLAEQGTEGCGAPQPLEAALKALTPSTSPIQFATGTGHGDSLDQGFHAAPAVVALLFVANADDCSFDDPSFLDPGRATPPLGERCSLEANALLPVQRYIDGLSAALSPDDRGTFSIIAGIPPVFDSATPDWRAILGDPRMQVGVDASGALTTACESADVTALPARRLATVARNMTDRGFATTAASICDPDLGPAMRAVAQTILGEIQIPCLPRIAFDADGRTGCRLRETLPADGPFSHCDALPGRTHARTLDGHEQCWVDQAPGGVGFWITEDPDCRHLSYGPGAAPPVGSSSTLDCSDASPATLDGLGAPCGSGAGACSAPLTCAPSSHTCALPCAKDADCLPGDDCTPAADGSGAFCARLPVCPTGG